MPPVTWRMEIQCNFVKRKGVGGVWIPATDEAARRWCKSVEAQLAFDKRGPLYVDRNNKISGAMWVVV